MTWKRVKALVNSVNRFSSSLHIPYVKIFDPSSAAKSDMQARLDSIKAQSSGFASLGPGEAETWAKLQARLRRRVTALQHASSDMFALSDAYLSSTKEDPELSKSAADTTAHAAQGVDLAIVVDSVAGPADAAGNAKAATPAPKPGLLSFMQDFERSNQYSFTEEEEAVLVSTIRLYEILGLLFMYCAVSVCFTLRCTYESSHGCHMCTCAALDGCDKGAAQGAQGIQAATLQCEGGLRWIRCRQGQLFEGLASGPAGLHGGSEEENQEAHSS